MTKLSVPVAPAVADIIPKETTMNVTWVEPEPSNGILQEYSVTYSISPSFNSPITIVQAASMGTDIVVRGLAAFMTYYVKVMFNLS